MNRRLRVLEVVDRGIGGAVNHQGRSHDLAEPIVDVLSADQRFERRAQK